MPPFPTMPLCRDQLKYKSPFINNTPLKKLKSAWSSFDFLKKHRGDQALFNFFIWGSNQVAKL
jgi:hypothetical protein